MRKLLLLVIVFGLLIGCSSQASKPVDINEELYKDSIEIVQLYQDYVENGKGSFDEVSKKWVYYTSNYSDKTKQYSDKEKDLFLRMSFLSDRVSRYDSAFNKGNLDEVKKMQQAYEIEKNAVTKMLNLE